MHLFQHKVSRVFILAAICIFTSCTTTKQSDQEELVTPKVATESVEPGTQITRLGYPLRLSKGSLKTGSALPKVELTDVDWKPYMFKPDGMIKIISIVPSVDTQTCDYQTNQLSKTTALNSRVQRITLSRDLPSAQKRYSSTSDLKNIKFLSDAGAFGDAAGLLIPDFARLLTRAVIVADGKGIVRYVQVVPELKDIPDWDRAFAVANKLAQPAAVENR